MVESVIKQYAVMGDPISHSLSPRIHKYFAAQIKKEILYEAINVKKNKLLDKAKSFFDNGGQGLNITTPLKIEAFQMSDVLSDRAKNAHAVNTLHYIDGQIYGDNTDGAGLIKDITINHKLALDGKDILVLGAGGAVRGIIEPLLSSHPNSLIIANRTSEKAELLVELFNKEPKIKSCVFDKLKGQHFDLIINGTAAGLSGELPKLDPNVLSAKTICYDLMYGHEDTKFVAWSKSCGVQTALDGLGMLVEQAAESFHIWNGIRPETHVVIDTLRQDLQ
jgi:shikimate dehydrogenase